MNKTALSEIKEAIAEIDYEKCMLFGSRARGTAAPGSDYDIIIVTREIVSHAEKFRIAASVRKKLAKQFIDADIIIRSSQEIDDFIEMRGSLVRNAMKEAIAI